MELSYQKKLTQLLDHKRIFETLGRVRNTQKCKAADLFWINLWI